MQKSTSFVGTVDVGLALEEETRASVLRPWYEQLWQPALFGTLMGIAISVRQAWGFTVAGLLILLAGGPQFISSTYTLWNWTMLLGQILDRAIRRDALPRLLPYLVVNSWAIFTSFNVVALIHPFHFRELANRLQYSMSRFHFMNTLGHFVPPLILTFWFFLLDPQRLQGACEWTSIVNLRFASLGYHFLWALRVGGGLRLDHVYLKRPKQQWYISWFVAAITHFFVGHFVDLQCRQAAILR